MRNCHKRWKRERKAERIRLAEGSDKTTKMLKELSFFLDKHPDQANYELEKLQAMK